VSAVATLPEECRSRSEPYRLACARALMRERSERRRATCKGKGSADERPAGPLSYLAAYTAAVHILRVYSRIQATAPTAR